MYFVFIMLYESFEEANEFLTKPKPILALFFSNSYVPSANTRTASATFKKNVPLIFNSVIREFKYTVNEIWLNCVPCGTPILLIADLLNIQLIWTNLSMSVRYDLKRSYLTKPHMPYRKKFSNNDMYGTMSMALTKFKNIAIVWR